MFDFETFNLKKKTYLFGKLIGIFNMHQSLLQHPHSEYMPPLMTPFR